MTTSKFSIAYAAEIRRGSRSLKFFQVLISTLSQNGIHVLKKCIVGYEITKYEIR